MCKTECVTLLIELKEIQKAVGSGARKRMVCDDTIKQQLSKSSYCDLQQLWKTEW